jgi:hypothetical protein
MVPLFQIFPYLTIPRFFSKIKPNGKMAINPFSFLKDQFMHLDFLAL